MQPFISCNGKMLLLPDCLWKVTTITSVHLTQLIVENCIAILFCLLGYKKCLVALFARLD